MMFAELLTWLADNMTRLASSPPPGVQPDNVEAQTQDCRREFAVICEELHCSVLSIFFKRGIVPLYCNSVPLYKV